MLYGENKVLKSKDKTDFDRSLWEDLRGVSRNCGQNAPDWGMKKAVSDFTGLLSF